MSVKIPVYPIVCEEILRPLRQVDDGINPYLSPNNDSHLLTGGLIRLLLASAAVTVTPQQTVRERGLLTNLPFESLSGGEINRERTPSTRGLPSRSAYAEPTARTSSEGS